MTRTTIGRRTVLRGLLGGGAAGGVAVTVPLPRLGGMLDDHGVAYADGTPLPRRFGTWFFGNGVVPDRWNPTAAGAGGAWQLSPELEPLKEVKPWLTVVSGLRVKIPNLYAHKSMPANVLTGAQAVQRGNVQLPSIDQRIAPLIARGTTFPTGIHVGISSTTGAGALDFNISFNGANAPNPPEYSPAALFRKLLGITGGGGAVGPDPSLLRRKRVLDAVAEDARALKQRLGREDQERLDRHLTGLGELQTQLGAVTAPRMAGPPPDPDKLYPTRGRDGSITRLRAQAFADLVTFALATDVTRVFSYVFTCAACHGSYADAGLDNVTFHEDYGHRKSPKGREYALEGFHKGVVYAITCLADLLTRLKNTPEGAGNLLDSACIYTTSCVSDSERHGGSEYPMLISGKARGGLKGDLHHRAVGDNVSKVPFTLLKLMGGTDATFGKDEGLVDSTLGAVLA
jgi:hypothetical protein